MKMPGEGEVGIVASGLRKRQAEFAAAILDPNCPVPTGLISPDGRSSSLRFSVYRNNVVSGLIEALKAAFPAVCRIVGEEFFSAMARVYVSCEPPSSPIMLDYGAGFPVFISTFKPAGGLAYLGDVARIERAWIEAYHAAEGTALDRAAFGRIPSRLLSKIRLAMHPSLRVVRSPFPIVALWQMNIDGGVPTFVDVSGGGEAALVVRPIAEVEVRTLPIGAGAFIEALAAGMSISGATASALIETPLFDLSRALSGLIEVGGIVGWSLPPGEAIHGLKLESK